MSCASEKWQHELGYEIERTCIQLDVFAMNVQHWLEWDSQQRQTANLPTHDGTHIMRLPVAPTYGQLHKWIETLARAKALITTLSAIDTKHQQTDLAAALVRVSLEASAENHQAVSDEYMRLGIFDKADEYLSAALELDPHGAATWDRKARIWRPAVRAEWWDTPGACGCAEPRVWSGCE